MNGFNILRWGDGALPPLVCLHGACGHARRFERLARMVSDRRHVVAYDLRGHGRSPWSGEQTLDRHAADLDAVLETCGIEQTVLLGHSLGARIALEYAAGHGERVTGLMLLDPPLFTPAGVLEAEAEAERRGRSYRTVNEAIAARRDDLRHTPTALLEEEMAEHLVSDSDGGFRFRYSRDAAARAIEALDAPAPLKAVVCPTLLVRGRESQLLTADAAEQAASELRRGRLETVPGGHIVLWDALAETGALVRSFLRTPSRA